MCCLCVIRASFQFLPIGSGVRCYNASDPELNSTAWFAIYLSSFVTFMTLDDLTSFVPVSQVCALFLNQLSRLEHQLFWFCLISIFSGFLCFSFECFFFFFTKTPKGKRFFSVYLSLLKIGGFLVNQENLDLFNNAAIPENVTNFYLTELFEFNPTFNPLRWVIQLLPYSK